MEVIGKNIEKLQTLIYTPMMTNPYMHHMVDCHHFPELSGKLTASIITSDLLFSNCNLSCPWGSLIMVA